MLSLKKIKACARGQSYICISACLCWRSVLELTKVFYTCPLRFPLSSSVTGTEPWFHRLMNRPQSSQTVDSKWNLQKGEEIITFRTCQTCWNSKKSQWKCSVILSSKGHVIWRSHRMWDNPLSSQNMLIAGWNHQQNLYTLTKAAIKWHGYYSVVVRVGVACGSNIVWRLK